MADKDTRKPGLRRALPEDIPPFAEALAAYRDPEKQSLITAMRGGDDFEWDEWKATIEYARRSSFDDILNFFVNLPSLQESFADEKVTGAWYWNPVQPVTLSTQFYYRPELLRMLRSGAGADALIKEGWLVKYEAGRIDTETTWSDTSYLIGTDGYFAYIQLYTIQVH